MKKLQALLLLSIILSFVLNSCQKDIVFVDGAGPDGKMPEKTAFAMSAKVDGNLINFNKVAAQQVDALEAVLIDGSSAAQHIAITIASFDGAKAYNIDNRTVLAIYTKNAGIDLDKDYYIATEGKITITAVTDKQLSGTFRFSGANSESTDRKVITEGKFTSKLTKQ